VLHRDPSSTVEATTGDLVLLGPIVRLQVQVAPLKQGERPRSWYDPGPITTVSAMRLEPGGVVGLEGEREYGDVHHMLHPLSRFRGENGVSVGLTSHYGRMRERFGDFLTDGIAGENILVETAGMVTEADVSRGVVIETTAGMVELMAVEGAPPCVEFSRFCAGYGLDQASDRGITETLQFLNEGMRGFYATLADGQAHPVIGVGDRVYLRR
jgi:hypothetical protein